MKKFIITKSDRDIGDELDLRKNKLSKGFLKYSYFQLDEKGEVTNYKLIYSGFSDFGGNLEWHDLNYFPKNESNDSFYNRKELITKERFKKFLKFCEKNGKVAYFNSVEDFQSKDLRDSFLEKKKERDELEKEIKRNLASLPTVETRNKKGQWRRPNIPWLIMECNINKKIYISGKDTIIFKTIHIAPGRKVEVMDSNINYYGYYSLFKDGYHQYHYGDYDHKVYKGGKKSVTKIIELYKDLEKIDSELFNMNKEYIENKFEGL